MSKPVFASGSVTGTGAAINISLGFIPDRVEVINVTDGDVIDIWTSTMPAGTSLSIGAGVAKRSSNGISAYAGSSTAAKGFTIGSGISESGKTLAWSAIRAAD